MLFYMILPNFMQSDVLLLEFVPISFSCSLFRKLPFKEGQFKNTDQI